MAKATDTKEEVVTPTADPIEVTIVPPALSVNEEERRVSKESWDNYVNSHREGVERGPSRVDHVENWNQADDDNLHKNPYFPEATPTV